MENETEKEIAKKIINGLIVKEKYSEIDLKELKNKIKKEIQDSKIAQEDWQIDYAVERVYSEIYDSLKKNPNIKNPEISPLKKVLLWIILIIVSIYLVGSVIEVILGIIFFPLKSSGEFIFNLFILIIAIYLFKKILNKLKNKF
ncbi:MAG: hypothetical protein V1732_02735 [Patescibacteria group bacterium]|nr:hypothetical protein [Patescibacteria group bacterium]